MKKLKSHLYKISVVILVILVHTLLAEAVVRYETFGLAGLSSELLESIPISNWQILSNDTDNCRIIKPWIPNKSLYFKAKLFETNSLGLGDKEYNITKGEDIFRVLVLGNSISLGRGVNMDEAYHSIVEDRLNDRLEGGKYEMLNLGCGPLNISKIIEDINQTIYYQPDMVMIFDVQSRINKLNQSQINSLNDYTRDYGVPVLFVAQDGKIKEGEKWGEILLLNLNVTKVKNWQYTYPADPHPDKYVHMEYATGVYDYIVENEEKIKNISNPKGYIDAKTMSRIEEIKNQPSISRRYSPIKKFWKSYYLDRIENKTRTLLKSAEYGAEDIGGI